MKKTDLINKDIIKALNPCNDRFNNYLKHYSDFSNTLQDFLSLDNITYSDKVWVITKLFTKEQNVAWSIKCAESVLSNFESVYPNDKRPRQALKAAQAYLNNPCEETQSAAESAAESAARSAWSAAWAAAWSAAESAARSARSAARSARSAESAESAVWAAARSAAESAARSAAWSAAESAWSAAESAAESAESPGLAEKEQEDINLIFMVEEE